MAIEKSSLSKPIVIDDKMTIEAQKTNSTGLKTGAAGSQVTGPKVNISKWF